MTSASIEKDILEALLGRVSTLGLGLAVSYPNRTFNQTTEDYLVVNQLPNLTQSLEWDDDGDSIHRGILQIDVVTPELVDIRAYEHVDAIINHFSSGTRMFRGEARVKVSEKPSIGPMLQGPQQVRVPVSIPYQTFS